MTYQNDPNRDINRSLNPSDPLEPHRVEAREGWGVGPIILASLAALAVVFGLFFMMSDRNPTVATNERPAVTTTPSTNVPAARETTGSNSSTINRTPDSTGSKPAIPGQVPAPATPNR